MCRIVLFTRKFELIKILFSSYHIVNLIKFYIKKLQAFAWSEISLWWPLSDLNRYALGAPDFEFLKFYARHIKDLDNCDTRKEIEKKLNELDHSAARIFSVKDEEF